MKISVNKAVSIYISFSLVILLCQSLIAKVLPVISYYDELFEISLICLLLFVKKTATKKNFIILMLLLLVIIVGVVGNFRSRYNLSFAPIVIDAIGILKPFIAVIAIEELCDYQSVKKTYDYAKKILETYIILGGVLYIPLYFLDRSNAFSQVRFGVPSYAFIAGNPGILGITVASILAFLSLEDNYYSSVKGKNVLMIGLLLCLATTKGPSLVFVGILLFLLILMKRKIKIWHIIPAILVIFGISQYQLDNYVDDATAPRNLLLNTGINLAKEYFPLGVGLGTFGDQASYDYYSPVYYKTGLANVWGFRPQDNAMVINDNYWPMLMAQFGFICACIVLGIYIYYFKKLNDFNDNYNFRKVVFITLYLTLMYMSLANAFLTAAIGEAAFMVIGLYAALAKNSNVRK